MWHNKSRLWLLSWLYVLSSQIPSVPVDGTHGLSSEYISIQKIRKRLRGTRGLRGRSSRVHKSHANSLLLRQIGGYDSRNLELFRRFRRIWFEKSRIFSKHLEFSRRARATTGSLLGICVHWLYLRTLHLLQLVIRPTRVVLAVSHIRMHCTK